ncbi:MAG TPA: PEP-CTERM sorting domain-containing protein [Planctomycetes bacterium]|nr:PEP-CTERM sorting domain-containing protein [Planctomycetota bacterium]
MIKTNKRKGIAWKLFLFAILVVIATVSRNGYGQIYSYFESDSDYETGYSLLIEQSPIDAGKVTPQTGLYQAQLDEVVTLTAIPKPGYQFVYWLGDVTEPGTNETTILVDSPKIVIAVFERSKFELPAELGIVGSRGRGGLRSTEYFRPRGISGGGTGGLDVPPPKEPPEPLGDEFPVPAEPFPVPENKDEEIPEPATIALFGLGSVLLSLSRGKRRPPE